VLETVAHLEQTVSVFQNLIQALTNRQALERPPEAVVEAYYRIRDRVDTIKYLMSGERESLLRAFAWAVGANWDEKWEAHPRHDIGSLSVEVSRSLKKHGIEFDKRKPSVMQYLKEGKKAK